MRTALRRPLSVSLLLASSFACSSHRPVPASGAPPEFGVASWYGVPFNGRLTASGEVYDMEALTAAHRTLPFGSVVRVVNLTNEKTIEVRINDRGPFVAKRIVDLSHNAAQSITMPGIANVRLEVIRKPSARGADVFAVQVDVLPDRDQAERLRTEMEREYGNSRVVAREGDQTWRVLVGSEPSVERGDALAGRLLARFANAVTVRVDPEN